jgi:hypothetical protein
MGREGVDRIIWLRKSYTLELHWKKRTDVEYRAEQSNVEGLQGPLDLKYLQQTVGTDTKSTALDLH